MSVQTLKILNEIVEERLRQDAKWGEQNHPDVDLVLTGRAGGCTPQRMAEHLEIPTAARAKYLTNFRAHHSMVTWADILIEELAEAVEAATLGDTEALRAELVQVAAVAVAHIEAIDRRAQGSGR